MPLFVKNNKSVLYIHVPKTGGSRIEQFFLANGFRAEFLDNNPRVSLNRFRRCSPQHMSAAQLLHVVRPARIDHVFMTVRDPLARLLSEYRMVVRVHQETLPLEPWLCQSLRRYSDDPYIFDNHLRPQVDFWMPGCKVVRQEDGFGEAFVAGIEQRLKIKMEDRAVGSVNRHEGMSIPAPDREAIRPAVAQFYREDYLRFGYA